MTLSRIVSHEPRQARSWRVVRSGERSLRVAYGLVSGSGVGWGGDGGVGDGGWGGSDMVGLLGSGWRSVRFLLTK